MLTLHVKGHELFDHKKQEFIQIPDTELRLEHSLYAIANWESKWHKAYFGKSKKTMEEQFDYIRCMSLEELDDPNIVYALNADDWQTIEAYIKDPHTATHIYNPFDDDKGGPKDTVTNELMYYWLVALQIPFEVQYWNLNHMLALIEVCNVKNDSGSKKASDADLRRKYAEISRRNKELARNKGKSI